MRLSNINFKIEQTRQINFHFAIVADSRIEVITSAEIAHPVSLLDDRAITGYSSGLMRYSRLF